MIVAAIVKYKLCPPDRETVSQVQENLYLQYFVGLPGLQMETPFPSLFVEIRKRMGQSVFDVFQSAIIDAVEEAKLDHNVFRLRTSSGRGRMTIG